MGILSDETTVFVTNSVTLKPILYIKTIYHESTSYLFKNSWTLRTVLLLTLVYIAFKLIFEHTIKVSGIVITFFVALYFVWGFGKRPKKSQQ